MLAAIDMPVNHTKKLLEAQVEPLDGSERIDLVVSWCGPNTRIRQEERKEFGLAPSRYQENGEMQILLKSVTMFADHIVGNVFIVVPESTLQACQLLFETMQYDGDNIVFITDESLGVKMPCFNSMAIEASLDRIPNLSPNFFYSCDDMFFSQQVDINDWIDQDGKYINLSQDKNVNSPNSSNTHKRSWTNNTRLIRERFGQHLDVIRPMHVIVMMSVQGLKDARQLFPDEILATQQSQIRSVENVHAVGLAINIDVIKDRATFVKDKNAAFFIGIKNNAFTNRLARNKNVSKLKHARLICVNDDVTNEDVREARYDWVRRNIWNVVQ
jgi:hypothetical protein